MMKLPAPYHHQHPVVLPARSYERQASTSSSTSAQQPGGRDSFATPVSLEAVEAVAAILDHAEHLDDDGAAADARHRAEWIELRQKVAAYQIYLEDMDFLSDEDLHFFCPRGCVRGFSRALREWQARDAALVAKLRRAAPGVVDDTLTRRRSWCLGDE
mmetsp:Transcript_23066/g.91481  ORF Transcript_23066/g.91481 Transcript_23066/m.91481 type:complete len:158 (+) Transcript_23066:89-562(+)